MTAQTRRQEWMAVLAKAPGAELSQAFDSLAVAADFSWLRPPETGAIMVRGRAGGSGAPFNLGEMSVTRCSLKLANGTVGHAYVPGRDHRHARLAAICDALMQGPDADRVEGVVIGPLRARHIEQQRQSAGKAAATKVDFFTMVRGEA